MTKSPEPEPRSQLDKFKDAAHDLETDDREEAFDEKLKKVANATPDKKATE